jgi:hypothetical protein
MRDVPYHPKEYGAKEENVPNPGIESGLWGALMVLGIALAGLVVAIVTFPFILLGFAEVVSGSMTHWRVRWVRRPELKGSK